MKFVPASGAATRMFRRTDERWSKKSKKKIERREERTEREFLEGIERLAFFDESQAAACRRRPWDPPRGSGCLWHLRRDSPGASFPPPPTGLGYESLPKALIPFHRYPDGPRTPFEEHLEEAAATVRDGRGVCRRPLHGRPEWRGALRGASGAATARRAGAAPLRGSR